MWRWLTANSRGSTTAPTPTRPSRRAGRRHGFLAGPRNRWRATDSWPVRRSPPGLISTATAASPAPAPAHTNRWLTPMIDRPRSDCRRHPVQPSPAGPWTSGRSKTAPMSSCSPVKPSLNLSKSAAASVPDCGSPATPPIPTSSSASAMSIRDGRSFNLCEGHAARAVPPGPGPRAHAGNRRRHAHRHRRVVNQRGVQPRPPAQGPRHLQQRSRLQPETPTPAPRSVPTPRPVRLTTAFTSARQCLDSRSRRCPPSPQQPDNPTKTQRRGFALARNTPPRPPNARGTTPQASRPEF